MILPFPKLYLYAGIALAILLAVGIIYKRGVDSGKAAQKEEMVADAKVQMEEVRKAAEAEFQRISTASEQAIQQAQAARQISERRESALLQSLAVLSQQRQSSQQAIAQIADSGLRSAIVTTLGIRGLNDSPQSYFIPLEERKILETLTDYKSLQQMSTVQSQQLQEVKEQMETFRTELKGVQDKLEAESRLRATYGQLYGQAYNLLRQKKRSARCLWLFRCSKEPLLSIPSPESLQPVLPPAPPRT